MLNPEILLSPVENGYVAYDPVFDRLHQLNPIAALVIELCDGSRSIESIRELTAPLMPEGRSIEIDRFIDEALKGGLLTLGADVAARHDELSAEELSALAKRLSDSGKVQTAFLCAKRAAELSPDSPEHWYALGSIAYSLGRRDDARIAYENYLQLHPEDARLQQLMVALRDEAPPPRAPNECIRQIYRRFSSNYETLMREELDYQAPECLRDTIAAAMGERHNLAILDLGCGSGLAGVCLKPWASVIVGVDLSPEMISLARDRNIYDRLEVSEITDWLGRTEDVFDLIVACECLNYFGDLHPVISAAARRLNRDGILGLTVERGEQYPFRLTDTGRYAHHPDHLRDVAAQCGMAVTSMDEGFLRLEYGAEVIGLYAILRKER
jgi:predicted TPR repeat methyltransferase